VNPCSAHVFGVHLFAAVPSRLITIPALSIDASPGASPDPDPPHETAATRVAPRRANMQINLLTSRTYIKEAPYVVRVKVPRG
jgi:hypothetical protein